MRSFWKLTSLSLVAVCLIGTGAQAQDGPFGYYNDALLFSRTTFGGTARVQAIGGAQVSLGGDQSLAGSNPAGLGFFNRSTIVVSPLLSFANADADYLGQSSTGTRMTFNMAHLGVALNYGRPNTENNKFRGGTFAITFNRINDFNSAVSYVGVNETSSIVDSFLANAQGFTPDELGDPFAGNLEAIAYRDILIRQADFFDVDDTGLIIPSPSDGGVDRYRSLVGDDGGSYPRQAETIIQRGGQNQINLSWGGNYLDKLYFGAGLGITTLRYRRERTYVEDEFFFEGERDDLINSITIDDRLQSNGTGVNATLGIIARPVDMVTVGLSYVTPSIYTIEEEYFLDFITDWNPAYAYQLPGEILQLGEFVTESDISVANYSLRTPGKVNAGATLFLGKNGFLTGDVEFIDYTHAQIKTGDFRESADNEEIKNLYRAVVNYRLGAEFRLDALRLRAGYAYQADPFLESTSDRSATSFTGGLGYRSRVFFIDLAVTHRMSEQVISPYFLDGATPTAQIDASVTNGILTIGVNF